MYTLVMDGSRIQYGTHRTKNSVRRAVWRSVVRRSTRGFWTAWCPVCIVESKECSRISMGRCTFTGLGGRNLQGFSPKLSEGGSSLNARDKRWFGTWFGRWWAWATRQIGTKTSYMRSMALKLVSLISSTDWGGTRTMGLSIPIFEFSD